MLERTIILVVLFLKICYSRHMRKIKIDVVVVPLSGHLFPTLNLLATLLQDPLYEIRLFTGPQRKVVAEEMGFQVIPILENCVD